MRKRNCMKKIFTLLTLFAILLGCEGEKAPEKISLRLEYSSFYFGQFEEQGGKAHFAIYCNWSWTVTENADWIELDCYEGKGNKSIEFTVAANGLTEDRSAVITVKSGDKTVLFTVTQDRADKIITFRDIGFFDAIMKNNPGVDRNKDGKISEKEAAMVGGLSLRGTSAEPKIRNMDELKYFTALESLNCYNNQLTSLDLSHNTALRSFCCDNNQLTSLDLSHNTALTVLQCENNQLTSLDLSRNTTLQILSCGNNQLTSLSLRYNTALTELYCYDNQFTSLDLRYNTDLTWFMGGPNFLITLDLRNSKDLKYLQLHYDNRPNNIIKTLYLSKDHKFPGDISYMLRYCPNLKVTYI